MIVKIGFKRYTNKLGIAALAILLFITSLTGCMENFINPKPTAQKYVMDMVYNNVGLPPRISQFNNPEFVKSIGYSAITPHWYVQCGITYDKLELGIVANASEERQWIEDNAANLTKKIIEAKAAGLKIYPFTDFMVVPNSVWKKYGNEMVADEHMGQQEIRNNSKPDIRKEMTKKVLRVQIEEIFETFPDLDGLVLRFGETYLHDTPYHVGNSPLRNGQNSIQDNIELLKILREEVCVKRDKTLFYRTWVHDIFQYDPTTYLAVTNEIEPHPNLVFAVKHTDGDFLRTFKFNRTLAIGKHQQVVEVQCQREYEGKQAHPNYIAQGVIEGFEEYGYLMSPFQNKGLKDIKNSSQFAGVWTWSRGGGWLGPYLKNEFWCEQNAFVIAKWAQNTSRSEKDIFNEFATHKGFSDEDIPKLREISLLSAKAVLRGKYSRYGHYSVVWTRDQFIQGSGGLNEHFEYVIKKGIVERVLAEKKESVDMWKRMVFLAKQIQTKDEALNEFLLSSTEYGRIKYEIIEKGWVVMLIGYIGDKNLRYDKERIREAIARYDELWEEWKLLEKNSPSSASIYEPNGFGIRGHFDIYGDQENGIGASIDKYR